MTTTQFTGGSFKHVDPSNYSTGKTGSEVTIHWSIADGAPIEEQTAMGERARVEAIRLAMGADKPYQYAPPDPNRGGMTEAAQFAVKMPPLPDGPLGSNGETAAPIVEPTTAGVTVVGGAAVQTAPGPLAFTPAFVPPAVVSSAEPPASADALPSTSSVAEISDKDLVDAATHHSARIMNAAPKDQVSQETAARKVSGLLVQFVPPGSRLMAIPQDKRQAFLDGLAAL